MSDAIPATLACAEQLHPVVVVRVVADVACDVRLLEPADPVLEPGSPRHGPRAGERVRVAEVGLERAIALGRVGDRDRRQIGDGRDAPGLGAGGEERVGQVDDRCHVLEGEPHCLDRVVEALARRRRRDHRQRRVGVPPEHHLEQVRLLVLRRHPGRGSGALDIDDDERQLDHHRQAESLALEGDAGARAGRQPERTTVARADRGADRRDLVLGLERLDPERFVARTAGGGCPRPG